MEKYDWCFGVGKKYKVDRIKVGGFKRQKYLSPGESLERERRIHLWAKYNNREFVFKNEEIGTFIKRVR